MGWMWKYLRRMENDLKKKEDNWQWVLFFMQIFIMKERKVTANIKWNLLLRIPYGECLWLLETIVVNYIINIEIIWYCR